MTPRDSPKAKIRIVNLEDGMPNVEEAITRLSDELAVARRIQAQVVKIIHGYGSSGAGGAIRLAVQRKLSEMGRNGEIQACIFGEDWTKSDEQAWKLLQARPELKQDSDLGRKNLGITIVLL